MYLNGAEEWLFVVRLFLSLKVKVMSSIKLTFVKGGLAA